MKAKGKLAVVEVDYLAEAEKHVVEGINALQGALAKAVVTRETKSMPEVAEAHRQLTEVLRRIRVLRGQ